MDGLLCLVRKAGNAQIAGGARKPQNIQGETLGARVSRREKDAPRFQVRATGKEWRCASCFCRRKKRTEKGGGHENPARSGPGARERRLAEDALPGMESRETLSQRHCLPRRLQPADASPSTPKGKKKKRDPQRRVGGVGDGFHTCGCGGRREVREGTPPPGPS